MSSDEAQNAEYALRLAEKHRELWGEGPVSEASYNPDCALCAQMIFDLLQQEYILIRTKTGRILTNDEIEDLMCEAEEGRDENAAQIDRYGASDK